MRANKNSIKLSLAQKNYSVYKLCWHTFAKELLKTEPFLSLNKPTNTKQLKIKSTHKNLFAKEKLILEELNTINAQIALIAHEFLQSNPELWQKYEWLHERQHKLASGLKK